MDYVVMTEITKLASMLAKADIPFEIVCWIVGEKPAIQIASPSKSDCIVDAALTSFTYGAEKGFLEVLGSANPDKPSDDVVGWLTAEEAFEYFINTKE